MYCPRTFTLLAIILAVAAQPLTAGEPADSPAPTPESYLRIAAETEAVLRKDILDKWFPAAIDRGRGGFFENFSGTWNRTEPTRARSVVYQSRLTWLAAQAAEQFPTEGDKYCEIGRHGLTFLAEGQWDQSHGGFFWKVDTSGLPRDRSEKPTYGIAFGLYAAATQYKVTKDPAALDLAKRTFTWLDGHGHDAQHGGFVESFTLDGKPMASTGSAGSDPIGTRYGGKSMNTSIHVLEALTALYAVWPDPVVRARLQEMFEIVRDKVYADPGCLTLMNVTNLLRRLAVKK